MEAAIYSKNIEKEFLSGQGGVSYRIYTHVVNRGGKGDKN